MVQGRREECEQGWKGRACIVGAQKRMERMQGGVWKGRAKIEGRRRRGRRMMVGFTGGDHGQGGEGRGSQRQGGQGGRGGAEPCTVWTRTLLS
jgi:hypothetical protein